MKKTFYYPIVILILFIGFSASYSCDKPDSIDDCPVGQCYWACTNCDAPDATKCLLKDKEPDPNEQGLSCTCPIGGKHKWVKQACVDTQ